MRDIPHSSNTVLLIGIAIGTVVGVISVVIWL